MGKKSSRGEEKQQNPTFSVPGACRSIYSIMAKSAQRKAVIWKSSFCSQFFYFIFIWKAGENAYNSYICARIEMTLQQSIHHSPLNQGRSSPGHWRYHSHNFQCHRQHQWCQCLAAWSATVSLTCVCGLSLCSASGSRHFQTLMAQDMLNVHWINIYVIMTHNNMPHKIMHAALGDIS